MVGGDLLAALEPFGVQLHECLAVRDERDDVFEPCDRVADAHLDRPESRVQADVPPDVRVVRDAARLLELAHDLCVVRVALEARRRPGSGEGGEDHLAARAQTGRLPAPERRAGRQRQ